jgi:antirestriction protein ArdC
MKVPGAVLNPVIENTTIEAFVKQTNAKFIVDDRAYYAPALDVIGLPPREDFKTPVAFESTRFHELVHWTGNESRLDRIESTTFGNHAYSVEELVAELTAAALCADFGLDKVAIEDSAAYVQHWLGVLKEHPQYLLTAGRQVDQAIAYLKGQPVKVPSE